MNKSPPNPISTPSMLTSFQTHTLLFDVQYITTSPVHHILCCPPPSDPHHFNLIFLPQPLTLHSFRLTKSPKDVPPYTFHHFPVSQSVHLCASKCSGNIFQVPNIKRKYVGQWPPFLLHIFNGRGIRKDRGKENIEKRECGG